MRFAVVGGGSWGTALARLAVLKGHAVHLWAREPEVRASIRERGMNEIFLPGVLLPDGLHVADELALAVHRVDAVVMAVPSQFLRAVFAEIASHLPRNALLVSAAKGIEEGTHLRMSQVILETVGDRFSPPPGVIALSGPTFAREVAEDRPTALVAAAERTELAHRVQRALSGPTFRVYGNDDVVGVEIGGAVKNVIALAAGVAVGLELGHNAVAALITRGLAEISRLAEALGGRRETLSGLAGIGDLVLTCTGKLSRNRSVGIELARGRPLSEILTSMRMVAEGVPSTRAAAALANQHGVEMPITFEMQRVLQGETRPAAAIEALMSRPLRAE